jgi:signal transduction histidine kinase
MIPAWIAWIAAAAGMALAVWALLRARAAVTAAEAARDRAEFRAGEAQAEAATARNEIVAAAAKAGAELAALERVRATLADLLNRLPVPIWRRGPDLELVDCNPSFAAAVDASMTQAVAERRMLGGDEAAQRARQLATLARTALTLQSDAFHVVIAGARRLLEITETPLGDGGTIGIAIDVTEREEAQLELARVVAGHGEVLEHLTTAIAIYGPDTRLRFFNTAFALLWWLDENWLRSAPDMNAVLDELRAKQRLPEVADFRDFRRQRLKLFTSVIEPIEELTYIPDGTTLKTRIMPHHLGGLLFTYENVTDLLVLERSYNTLIAVQRETLDNLHEGVAVIGSDGRLKLFNPTFAALWKLDADWLRTEPHVRAIVEATRDFYDATEEPEAERLVAHLTERVQRAERIERADGTTLDLSVVPLPDGGVLLSYIDVSDSMRVEHALRERAAALEIADRLKSEFISSVSYELRTPLNTIIGFAEILSHRYYGDLNPRQLEYCRDIVVASERLMTIINDILDLASIEAGRMSLDRQTVAVPALLDACAHVMSDAARGADLQLRVESGGDMPPIDGDERRLKQAICNLILNAIKFTPGGGTVSLFAEHRGDFCAVGVRDTGVGISPEYHARVFRAFERLRQRDKPVTGAGLGLSLVRRIVELHGGSVELVSAPGEGTTVSCLLPYVGTKVETPVTV